VKNEGVGKLRGEEVRRGEQKKIGGKKTRREG
jgi:hypothetical protein